MRTEQIRHVAGARGVQVGLKRNAAEQAEITAAQQRRVFLEPRRKHFHALVGAYFVEDHAEHFRVFRAAEHLRLQLNAAGELGQYLVFRGGYENDFRIQRLGHVQIDPGGIAGAACRDHAFDDQHVAANRCLLIQVDDFFKQLVELAFAEHTFNVSQPQRLGRLEAVGARDQFS